MQFKGLDCVLMADMLFGRFYAYAKLHVLLIRHSEHHNGTSSVRQGLMCGADGAWVAVGFGYSSVQLMTL